MRRRTKTTAVSYLFNSFAPIWISGMETLLKIIYNLGIYPILLQILVLSPTAYTDYSYYNNPHPYDFEYSDHGHGQQTKSRPNYYEDEENGYYKWDHDGNGNYYRDDYAKYYYNDYSYPDEDLELETAPSDKVQFYFNGAGPEGGFPPGSPPPGVGLAPAPGGGFILPPGSPPPPFGFPDPGFKTQSGFEGFLVPNSWYGLLPWGIEGVVIVIAGIIVFAIIVIAIIALLAWLCGIKKVFHPLIAKSQEELTTRWRDEWSPTLTNLTTNVFDALDKFSNAEEVLVTSADDDPT